jgi:hypothetical protein
LNSFEHKLIEQNARPSVDQGISNIPGREESNLDAMQNASRHQTAFPIMGNCNIREQVTFESVSPEFQEQVWFLAVQEIFFVKPPHLLKSRPTDQQTACVQKRDPNGFGKRLLAL